MCVINIIHFSHHDLRGDSSPSCNFNLFTPSNPHFNKLNLPYRLTETEFMSQRQPPHEFALCPTHINSCCVVYKQTTPCPLWRFHSSDDVGGVNAAGCPNLESMSFVGPRHPKTVSQARISLLSTADEIHKQKLTMDRNIVEASELMELLLLELAEACASLLHKHQPAAKRQAFFLRELETPLNQCAELCEKIREADEAISELFKVFLQRRKGMADLVVALEKKNKDTSTVQEFAGCDVYPVGKARQILRELSVANVREVCEGPVRRGRELRKEMVRLLERVETFMQPVS
ncbi:hypothetical protein QBC32DRAFT_393272 [Pseudoneurospora amorphoporcata]|uniref:Uncharacterized protein n=1 Tax=Pseudoneurospora amorphoporcata TaxID=241081 RepID=A0AAN6NS71_9PEZI|nr:hypothetical protein QBC32DRAFT_393272 [Pseudoneurospora amorphoporcata]